MSSRFLAVLLSVAAIATPNSFAQNPHKENPGRREQLFTMLDDWARTVTPTVNKTDRAVHAVSLALSYGETWDHLNDPNRQTVVASPTPNTPTLQLPFSQYITSTFCDYPTAATLANTPPPCTGGRHYFTYTSSDDCQKVLDYWKIRPAASEVTASMATPPVPLNRIGEKHVLGAAWLRMLQEPDFPSLKVMDRVSEDLRSNSQCTQCIAVYGACVYCQPPCDAQCNN